MERQTDKQTATFVQGIHPLCIKSIEGKLGE